MSLQFLKPLNVNLLEKVVFLLLIVPNYFNYLRFQNFLKLTHLTPYI